MGKTVEIPRYFVLSGRFSKEENDRYRGMMAGRGLESISDMVREAMALWEKAQEPGPGTTDGEA